MSTNSHRRIHRILTVTVIALIAAAIYLVITASEKPFPFTLNREDKTEFPLCVIKVWEDGSAAFKDAEMVQADKRCHGQVLAWVEDQKRLQFRGVGWPRNSDDDRLPWVLR